MDVYIYIPWSVCQDACKQIQVGFGDNYCMYFAFGK